MLLLLYKYTPNYQIWKLFIYPCRILISLLKINFKYSLHLLSVNISVTSNFSFDLNKLEKRNVL